MSLMRRIVRLIKTTITLSGSPLLLSVPGRLPGPIQIPGSLFSVVDGQVLEAEIQSRGAYLDPELKAQFNESVGNILSGLPDRGCQARETLQVLARTPPLDASPSVHTNCAVAHALVGNLEAAQESIALASTTLQGLILHGGERATILRRCIRDNRAEIRARSRKPFSG